jgi:methyl-accepting chemotaxis protein
MAKKKSKNKRKKLAKERSNGSESWGGNLRQAGTVAAAAIVGEIVEATVERLIHKASQSKNAMDDSRENDRRSEHHNQSAIADTTSKLRDGVRDVKPTLRDAAEAVKDSLGEVKPTLTDVADSLKEAAQETLQRSLAVANPAEMTVESALDTAKTVIGSVRSTGAGKPDKKGKKKNKKKA